MTSLYENFDTAESNKSAENFDNEINMSDYYKTVTRVNKKGIRESKDRYVFINELIDNFDYDRNEIDPIFEYTTIIKGLNTPETLYKIKTTFKNPPMSDPMSENKNDLIVEEEIPPGILQINNNLSKIKRGIVFIIGNVIHATIIIFDLDTGKFYNTGFGFLGIDPEEGIRSNGALYTVDFVLPDKDQPAGIIWVQELTPEIKHNIQEELSKITKIYHKFKITSEDLENKFQNQYELSNQHILTGNLINFYKSEHIYKDYEQHGRIPTDVANCVRWAFRIIGQSAVLYDPRIRLCKDLKKPEFCRVLRNRLWTQLKENMLIYLHSHSIDDKSYVYSQILDSLKDINNRFLRRRKKTEKRSGTPRRERLSPGRLSPGRLSPGRLSPGRLSPGRLSPGRLSTRRLMTRSVSPRRLLTRSVSPTRLSPEILSLGPRRSRTRRRLRERGERGQSV
jgi:hypothetical protein